MKVLLALTISCTTFVVGQTLVLAKPALVHPTHHANSVTTNQKVSFVPPPVPTSEPPPGGRVRGGAKRGLCPSAETQLTALVPFTQDVPTVTNVWGLTTQAHPTLLFYVPYSKNSTYPVEFVLQDQDANLVYQKAIALPNQPGIISISLPADSPALAVNKRYRWFFSVYCDSGKQAPPVYVEGVIERVNLSQTVTQQLQTASPLQQSAIYADNGIWYEALLTLAQLRQQKPGDQAIQQQWQNLLTSVQLGDITTKPLTYVVDGK